MTLRSLASKARSIAWYCSVLPWFVLIDVSDFFKPRKIDFHYKNSPTNRKLCRVRTPSPHSDYTLCNHSHHNRHREKLPKTRSKSLFAKQKKKRAAKTFEAIREKRLSKQNWKSPPFPDSRLWRPSSWRISEMTRLPLGSKISKVMSKSPPSVT